MQLLKDDPEFADVFADIQKNGMGVSSSLELLTRNHLSLSLYTSKTKHQPPTTEPNGRLL